MIIKCPKCNSNISDRALKCPQCGHPINKIPVNKIRSLDSGQNSNIFKFILLSIGIIAILFIVLNNNSSRQPTKQEILKLHKTFLTTVKYNKLNKARELCWIQNRSKIPNERDWEIASDQWRHLGNININVDKQPVGGNLFFGTCKPEKSIFKVKWSLDWENDSLKYSKPLKNGLYQKNRY